MNEQSTSRGVEAYAHFVKMGREDMVCCAICCQDAAGHIGALCRQAFDMAVTGGFNRIQLVVLRHGENYRASWRLRLQVNPLGAKEAEERNNGSCQGSPVRYIVGYFDANVVTWPKLDRPD